MSQSLSKKLFQVAPSNAKITQKNSSRAKLKMALIEIISYLVAGSGAGILAGLLGVGGGLIIVPVLLVLFAHLGYPAHLLTQLAVGTSLASIVITGISSTWAHHRHAAVDWRIVQRMALGIMLGALCGAYLATRIDSYVLKKMIGVFALLVSVQMGLQLQPRALGRLQTGWRLSSVAAIIGAVSSLIGIGGGSLTVPYLLWAQQPIRRAVATSAACGVPIGMAGALGFVLMGWGVTDLPPNSAGYVMWPAALIIAASSTLAAQFGAYLTHTLPVQVIKRVFALVLLLVGLRLILS